MEKFDENINSILSTINLLIVDDDIETQKVYTMMVSGLGLKNVYCASSGMKAIEILSDQNKQVDIITIDYMMGEIDGIELAQHIVNKHSKPICMIMITGYYSEEVKYKFEGIQSDSTVNMGIVEKTVLNSKEIKSLLYQAAIDLRNKQRQMLIDSERILLNEIHKNNDLVYKINKSNENIIEKINKTELKVNKILLSQKKDIKWFLSILGFEVLKIILIGILVLLFFSLDLQDFLRSILGI